MSGRLITSLRKRKLQLIEKEASEKYLSGGMEAAKDHVDLYFKVLARSDNPFEREENIQSRSFIIDKTIVVKAYNVNTGFTYMYAQVNIDEEIEMDSKPSCTKEEDKAI